MKKSLVFAVTAQAISIVVLLVLAFEFFSQIASLKEYSAKVEHAYKVINQIARVQSGIKDAETSSRGYLLADDKDFLVSLSKSAGAVLPNIDSLRKLIPDNTDQINFVKRIDTLAFVKTAMMIENTRLRNRIPIDSINFRLSTGKYLMDSIDIYLEKMRAIELTILEDHRLVKTRYERNLPKYVQWVFLTAGLLTMLFGLWIYIELRRRFRYQSLLQVKLNELRQSNEELEQIAFAASHDLQEPLRKIRIFSDRLLIKAKDNWTEEQFMMLQRMNLSAARLQDLIGDLVIFNQLVQNQYSFTKVSLREVVSEHVLRLQQKEPGTAIEWAHPETYPFIYASVDQINILFQQIFNNALQFKSGERPLLISIDGELVEWTVIKGLPSEVNHGNFFRLSIRDNGIGFDESFKDKMFKPFQRLHNVETENNTRRKGMGLALCKRVMVNLGGWIDAEGKVNEGAVIHLYFPVI